MGLAPRQSYPRYSSKWDFSSDAQEFRKYAYAKNLSFLSFFSCLLLPLLPRKIIPRASATLPRETQFERGPIFVSRSVLSIAKLGFFRSTYRRNPRRWDESWSFFPFLPLLNFLASGETSFSGERERGRSRRNYRPSPSSPSFETLSSSSRRVWSSMTDAEKERAKQQAFRVTNDPLL